MPLKSLGFNSWIIFLLLLGGCASKKPFEAATTVKPPMKVSEKLNKMRSQAYQQSIAQNHQQAIVEYEEARNVALEEGNQQLAVQFLMNVAGCYQAMSAYRDAMQIYRRARDESQKSGLIHLETTTALNMASLLLELGEVKSAGDLLNSYPLDGSTMPPDARLQGFMLHTTIFLRLNDLDRAENAFQLALAEAERPPSPELAAAYRAQQAKWSESAIELRRAWAFAMYSQALMRADRYEEAERYSLEAFRLRATYQDRSRLREVLQLAMILRNRKDFTGAYRLLEVARKLDPGNRTQTLLFLLEREEARIALAQKDFKAALAPLRSALQKARAWRLEVIPSDSTFLNFEANLSHEIQDAFLLAMIQPTFDLNQPGVAEESLWIAEEARFASMRAAQFPASEFSNRLPGKYWSTLSQFRKLQSQIVNTDSKLQQDLLALERELNLIELEVGLNIPHSKLDGLPQVREWTNSLSPDNAVFSYFLAEPFSLAWTATRKGITVRRIASRTKLKDWVEKFRAEIQDSSRNGKSSTGMELSKQLFGENLLSQRTTPFWTMVLDQELSTLPISALPAGKTGDRYLIEDHSLRVLPSAIFLQSEASPKWSRQAIGIGDAVYNQADRRSSPLQYASTGQMELNRLPASAKELQISFNAIKNRNWLTKQQTGVSATVDALGAALGQSPDILHLSTHFVPQAGSPHLLNIALSPSSGQTAIGLFSALDLNAVRTKTKLVVLSGCSSSTGEVVSSIGINGLSRAFLVSGVSTVVATLWQTDDTEGPLFPVFYQNLLRQKWSSRAAAESLRAAQLQMIRQGGWTSKPSYWAAYLAISKG